MLGLETFYRDIYWDKKIIRDFAYPAKNVSTVTYRHGTIPNRVSIQQRPAVMQEKQRYDNKKNLLVFPYRSFCRQKVYYHSIQNH